MKLKYEGTKFNGFKKDLKNINIPHAFIHCMEDINYCKLPGNYVFIYSFHCDPEKKDMVQKL